MSARRWVIGCSAAAGLTLLTVIVVGVLTFRHLTAPVPLPDVATLLDGDTVGVAVLKLEPKDPWVQGAFLQLSRYSFRDQDPTKLFPLEIVWTLRRSMEPSAGHSVMLSFSPRGRLFGMVTDFALWRAGRSGGENVLRMEHAGEGITSFPGTRLKGHVFVRGNALVWSSDLTTAESAVDRLAAPSSPGVASTPLSPVIARLPQPPGHTAVGAVLGEGDAVARLLGTLPGVLAAAGPLEIPEGTGLMFHFDTLTASTGSGEMTLQFPAGTPDETIRRTADGLAAGLAGWSALGVSLKAMPRLEGRTAAIGVSVEGLDALLNELMVGAGNLQRDLEHLGKGERVETGEPDPNQSSSTFQ